MFVTKCLVLFLSIFEFTHSKTVFNNIFTEIRNKKTFVDKTPLIYEFLKHKYLFINAPSKFGKSANLDMISLFLSNHRPKKTIENFFIWTRIWENKEFVEKHLGQYPVIHFNLKMRGYSSDFERTIVEFKVSLYNAFIDHAYLLESTKLSAEQLSLLADYMDLTKTKLMDTDSLAKGFSFLAEVLFQHHGKQVILLADEFGRGITEGIIKNHAHLNLVMELYSGILNNTLYNENIISKALFTGESWLYGLKDPAVSLIERVSFMQNVEIGRFYGFTYDEVKQLMANFSVSKESEAEVFKWYAGYSTYDSEFKVCNPYSITQYLSHKKRQEIIYWTGSPLAPELIPVMMEIDTMKKHILNLVWRKSVDMNLEKGTKLFEWEYLQQKVKQLPQYCENFFLQILLETGYLTFAENQVEPSKVALKFPNEEVRSAVVRFTV